MATLQAVWIVSAVALYQLATFPYRLGMAAHRRASRPYRPAPAAPS